MLQIMTFSSVGGAVPAQQRSRRYVPEPGHQSLHPSDFHLLPLHSLGGGCPELLHIHDGRGSCARKQPSVTISTAGLKKVLKLHPNIKHPPNLKKRFLKVLSWTVLLHNIHRNFILHRRLFVLDAGCFVQNLRLKGSLGNINGSSKALL